MVPPLSPDGRLLRCHGLGLLSSSTLQNREIPRARKRAHHQSLDPTADLDLVAGSISEIDASALRYGFGDDELTGVGLGERFDAARGIDGVADRGDRDGGAVTHFADDGGAGMDADADPQRLDYVVNQRAVEGLHSLRHILGCRGRPPAAGPHAPFRPKPRPPPLAAALVQSPPPL